MNLGKQQLGDLENLESEKRILRSCSAYIEQKFRDGKRAEILPQKIQEIINMLINIKNKVETNPNAQDLLSAISTLESSCDAAVSLYPEPQNRKFYFDQLKGILPELNRVLRILGKYR